MSLRSRFPFEQGTWADLWPASMVLLRTMVWQRQRATRGVRVGSPRWLGHLFALVCIWTMSWFTNPVGFAAYRLLPGSGWVGGRSSVMTLRRSGRDCWVIANFGACPGGGGVGAPVLARVCTVADTHGYTLRLVAHNSELGDKVYKPAGFAVTGTRRGQRVVMERIPNTHAELSLS
jgi:hypothetical protein